jgi:prepilin-type N-terminal cleavage/methylation domain-containing protein
VIYKNKMKNNKGFTLIEMLVVIAIIGLLSSVVLVALGPSRNKAKDARIISDINQARAAAETLFDPSTGVYPDTTLILGAEPFASLNADLITNNDGTAMIINGAGTNAYAISAKLNTGFYCVDSSGKTGTLSAGSATACP